LPNKKKKVKSVLSFELEELIFHFKENPYFTEKTLKKTYILFDDPSMGEVFDHMEGTDISWQPGMNLRKKLVTKTQKVKGGGRKGRGGRGGDSGTKQYTVEEDVPSFFDFFEIPSMDMIGEEDDDEMSPEEELQAMMEDDFEIGVTIRDFIISNAVNWFTGEVPRMGGGDFDDGEDDNGDEEDFNSEDDEDFDPKKHAPQGKPGEKQECKQQ